MRGDRPGPPAHPARIGNGELGRNHFSGKHNIKKCAIVNIPIQGNVDSVHGAKVSQLSKRVTS
ncbi:hypothetical protein [Streptomyces sp. NPDC006552]|uniref:hypothetical protein n=1 Tax=Streptomyces sp. NPDC006552 TaxID=3157179 RepID=UPI0033A1FC06